MQAPGPAPQWCPPVADIDALELLRGGAVAEDAVLAGISIPDEVPAEAAVAEVVDPEGVPLARVALAETADGGRAVSGVEAWLSPRSSRPFERLHRSPGAFHGPAPTLVVNAGTDVDEVAAAAAATPGLRIVVVGSVAGDGTGVVTAAIRALLAMVTGLGATIVVAPGTDLLAAAVGAAYAHGGEVRSLLGEVSGVEEPRGVVLLLTGLSGSGKSTIAKAVRDHLVETTDQAVTLLDGDEVRRHLSAGLTFSVADRETNIRRIGWVAAEIAHHGGLVICSPIAPFASTRADVRRFVDGRGARFVLVHVATPLAECERRDRKGLYARARAGLIPDFTGISSPYEDPDDADLVIDTTDVSIGEARDRVLDLLATMLPGVHR